MKNLDIENYKLKWIMAERDVAINYYYALEKGFCTLHNILDLEEMDMTDSNRNDLPISNSTVVK